MGLTIAVQKHYLNISEYQSNAFFSIFLVKLI